MTARISGFVSLTLLVVLLSGCGGPSNEAPVSGTVSINGKPTPGLWVVFQPLGTKDNPNPGRGSTAKTDENGRYVLRIDGVRNGAVVGEHRVAIATVVEEGKNVNPETGSPDGEQPAVKTKERIPDRFNDRTTLRFVVPKGGTDKADFDLDIPEEKRPPK